MLTPNQTGSLQKLASTGEYNAVGEAIKSWSTVASLSGFLDLSNADSRYNIFSAKIKQATHMFIADYQDLSAYKKDNLTMVVNGTTYDVKYIDDPLELHHHLEVYLEYTGV